MFKEFGFTKEYYIENKFIGTISTKKDRDIYGYNGKKLEKIDSDIILDNKRKIKKNTEVVTMIYPLCGKLKK